MQGGGLHRLVPEKFQVSDRGVQGAVPGADGNGEAHLGGRMMVAHVQKDDIQGVLCKNDRGLQGYL